MENLNQEWIPTPLALKTLHMKNRGSLNSFAHKHHIRVSKPSGKMYYNLNDILSTLSGSAIRKGL